MYYISTKKNFPRDAHAPVSPSYGMSDVSPHLTVRPCIRLSYWIKLAQQPHQMWQYQLEMFATT